MADATAKDLSKLTVLVVDDNSYMVQIINTMLRALKITKVKRAHDGTTALEILNLTPVDIVITDWNMEPMSGIDLVRHLRSDQDGPNANVPIIMVTGFTEMDRVLEARDAGVAGFLKKPLSTNALYNRIVEAVAKPAPDDKSSDDGQEWSVNAESSPTAECGS